LGTRYTPTFNITQGNIAGDSPVCRDFVLNLGALKPLVLIISDTTNKITMIRNATWTLSNFTRGKNPAPEWNQISPALQILSKLVYSTDEEVLCDACWALSYLSDGSNEKIQAVIEAGVCRRLVELLMSITTSSFSNTKAPKLLCADPCIAMPWQHCHR